MYSHKKNKMHEKNRFPHVCVRACVYENIVNFYLFGSLTLFDNWISFNSNTRFEWFFIVVVLSVFFFLFFKSKSTLCFTRDFLRLIGLI